MAIDPNFTRVRLNEAIDHLEKGGLTAAARAQEHDILAFVDRKGDIVYGLMGAESFGYIFDDDHFAAAWPVVPVLPCFYRLPSLLQLCKEIV
jgi:hypothetical protein